MTSKELLQTPWQDVKKQAEALGNTPVVYCIFFAHGLMKAGITTNMSRRLTAIASHGLFEGLVSELVATPCPKGKLSHTEKKVLNALSATTERKGQEIFAVCDSSVVANIITNSINDLEGWDYKPMTDKDYEDVKEYFKPALLYLARERADRSAVDTVLDYMDMPEIDAFSWERALAQVGQLAYPLIAPLIEKNAVLIGRGVEYEDRKKMLEQVALDMRSGTALLK